MGQIFWHMAPHIYFLRSFCACFACRTCTCMLYPHVIQVCCACVLYPHVGTLCLHGGKLCYACTMCLWNLTHIHSYGFQVMCSYESPLIPFQIFTLWFPTPSWTIIFDTACKLHVYCLQREPALYKDSYLILCWPISWRGHGYIDCRKCYFVDMYNSMKALNSQVNEQANAGLQWIWGQLAYMTPSNYILTLCFDSM